MMTPAGEAFAPVRFSTGNLRQRQRLTAYREMLDRSVGHFEVDSVDDRFTFSANSSRSMRRDTVAWLVLSCRAAVDNCPVRATARKYIRSSQVNCV